MKQTFLAFLLSLGTVLPCSAQSSGSGRSELATLEQVVQLRLEPEQISQLSERARTSYVRAQQLADRIDYAGAIDSLAEAAAAAPETVDLQFMLIKAARWRAETTYGEDSVRYYDHAEAAIRRLLSNPTLGPIDRSRVRRESERVTTGQENLRARDEARSESGFKLVLQIRSDRLARSGLVERSENPFGIEQVLEQNDVQETEDQITAADIWDAYAAPGFEFPRPQLPQGNPFGFGGGFEDEFGADPFGGGGQFGGGDPFGGGGGDPFAAGGDPFGGGGGDPFAGGGDPFGGGGQFGGGADPFGGGGTGADPFGIGQK